METNQLYRIPSRGSLGGVAAGLAERFGTEVWVMRLVFVLGTLLTHGPFFLVYLILWVALPAKPALFTTENSTVTESLPMKTNSGNTTGGIILILIGTIFLLNEYIDIDFGKLWPLFLIAIGVYILFKDSIKSNFKNEE